MAIYKVEQNTLVEVPKTDFGSQGIFERQDLQRLLRTQIQVLSPDLMVIAEEFGDWEDSNHRIDLLCIDSDANLVVVELKRTQDGGHMELQAIRYAAMISTMTFPQMVNAHAKFLGASGNREQAQGAILGFLGWEEPHEELFARDIRIILASADFGRELTTAVLWLNQQSLDIRCIRLKPHRMEGGGVLLDVQQIIPLPEAEDYQTRLASKEHSVREQRTLSQEEALARAPESLQSLWEQVRTYILSLGNGVSEQNTRLYAAFKKGGKHIICGRVYPGANLHMKLWLKLDPDQVQCEVGFSRDVRAIGHYGTGDFEIVVTDLPSLERAKELIHRCYQES